jgi:hypothetical protein
MAHGSAICSLLDSVFMVLDALGSSLYLGLCFCLVVAFYTLFMDLGETTTMLTELFVRMITRNVGLWNIIGIINSADESMSMLLLSSGCHCF